MADRQSRAGAIVRLVFWVFVMLLSILLGIAVPLMPHDEPFAPDPYEPPAARDERLQIRFFENATTIALGLSSFPLFILSIVQLRKARRYLAKSAMRAGDDPIRPSVIYLRDFSHDQPTGWWNRWLSITSEEEALIKALRLIGPPLAIGRPGEELPPLGAPRLYFAEDEWQDRVSQLVHSARLIVIRTGQGDGLRWEVEHVIHWIKPEQLLIVVFDQDSFATFQRWTSSVVHWPEPRIVFKGSIGGYLCGFIVFDANWCPIVIRVKRLSILRGGFFHSREFRKALDPTIKRFAAGVSADQR